MIHEQAIFEKFKREALAFLSPRPESDLEWLAVAQHHGLPTRLLDWSSNPLIALYFAATSPTNNYRGDGVVFAINTFSIPKCNPVEPFKGPQLSTYNPPHIAARVVAQRGFFTVHNPPMLDLAHTAVGIEVHELVIKSSARAMILMELDWIGFGSTRVFPDLDGLVRHLRTELTDDSLPSVKEPYEVENEEYEKYLRSIDRRIARLNEMIIVS